MRKSYTDKIIWIVLAITLAGFAACKGKSGKDPHAAHEAQQYTCPMHPQIVRDAPGKCPICGMDLVPKSINNELSVDSSIEALAKPVNAQVIADIGVIKPESGIRIFSTEINGQVTYDTRNQVSVASRVSGRIEKLYIKYNYQPVKQGQLIMEIYSPDLAAAQRELLFIARTGDDDGMLAKAKQRLSLLGMQPNQIEQILKTGKVLYRVPVYSNASGYILEKQAAVAQTTVSSSSQQSQSSDGMGSMGGSTSNSASGNNSIPATSSTPFFTREGQYAGAGQSLFTIYRSGNLVAEFALKPELASQVKTGQQLVFRVSGSDKVYTGRIGLIQPVVRSGENFTLTRVYLNQQDLYPGQLLLANIPVMYKNGYWLPKKAVWQSGSKAIVFKKNGDVFVPMEVDASVEAEGMVLVTTPGIGDWEIASNAWYLVDSESFIKTTDQNKDE